MVRLNFTFGFLFRFYRRIWAWPCVKRSPSLRVILFAFRWFWLSWRPCFSCFSPQWWEWVTRRLYLCQISKHLYIIIKWNQHSPRTLGSQPRTLLPIRWQVHTTVPTRYLRTSRSKCNLTRRWWWASTKQSTQRNLFTKNMYKSTGSKDSTKTSSKSILSSRCSLSTNLHSLRLKELKVFTKLSLWSRKKTRNLKGKAST